MKKLKAKRIKFLKNYGLLLCLAMVVLIIGSVQTLHGAIIVGANLSVLGFMATNFQGVNTGTPNSKFTPAGIIGAILIPHGTTIADTGPGTYKTNLKTLFTNAPATRGYPIFKVEGFKENTKKTTYYEGGYGITKAVMEGRPNYTFSFFNGFGFNNKLRQWNGFSAGFDVLFLDSSFNVWGTKNPSSATSQMGFVMDEFHAEPITWHDGNKQPALYEVTLQLNDVKAINENVLPEFQSQSGLAITDFNGILDVTLTQGPNVNTALTSNVYLTTSLDGVDFATLYQGAVTPTLLQILTCWSVTNATTGATLAVSAVAFTAGTGGNPGYFTITYATSGAAMANVSLAANTVLATNGVGGAPGNNYESNILLCTH